MTTPQRKLLTSEMMSKGQVPKLFTGGACNIQGPNGVERNTGRDALATWLDEKGWTYFDPQVHPSTHGREYIWGIDGPEEKRAREMARLRIYEITSTTIASVTMLEIMEDARLGRSSIVWYHDGNVFAPVGLGNYDDLRNNAGLREQVGESVFAHLIAYVKAGRHLRNELPAMLMDCTNIVFVNSFNELKNAIVFLLSKED